MKRILCCLDDDVLVSEFFPGETVYIISSPESIYKGTISQVSMIFDNNDILKFQYAGDFEGYGKSYYKTGDKPKFFKTKEEVIAFVDATQAESKEKILGKYFESSSFQRKIED